MPSLTEVEKKIVEFVRGNGAALADRMALYFDDLWRRQPMSPPPLSPPFSPQTGSNSTYAFTQIVDGEDETEILITMTATVIRKRRR